MKSQLDLGLYEGPEKSDGKESKDDRWRTITTISLPMAYVTRYLWGTDNIRISSTVLLLELLDGRVLEQWLTHIYNHIQALNPKTVKMSNKYLHQSEPISYIGWVNEYIGEEQSEDPKQRWEPRFLILKGGDVCLFETPPVGRNELRIHNVS